MHFEILVEGQAELTALSIIMTALEQYGKRSVRILEQKRIWAKEICQYFDVQLNQSPSFQAFRDGVRKMTTL